MDTGQNEIAAILEKIHAVKILLYGDFCLDVYWTLDPRGSEISVETGLQALAAGNQNYSLGGAANVAANLAALNPRQIKITGVAGDDIFGREMIAQLSRIGVDISGLVLQNGSFETYAFCKLILEGNEQPRIDFGRYNRRTLEADARVLEYLQRESREVDVILINQQIPESITNRSFIDGINRLVRELPDKMFIVDSRHHAADFEGVALKTNQVEAALLCGVKAAPGARFEAEKVRSFARTLYARNQRPCFISRGRHGIIACDAAGIHEIPGLRFRKKLDTVGAGDTTLSAIACALAAGVDTPQAIALANFAAGVTVQKLFQTGTASPEEILALCADPHYLALPELDGNTTSHWTS